SGAVLRRATGNVRRRLAALSSGGAGRGDITLSKPIITVSQTPDGRMNIATLGAGGKEPPKPAERTPRGGGGSTGAGTALFSKISIDDGIVSYVARGKAGATSQYRIEELSLTLTGGGPQLGFKSHFKVKPGHLAVQAADG